MTANCNKVLLLGRVSVFGVSLTVSPTGARCAMFLLLVEDRGLEGKLERTMIPCEAWYAQADAALALTPGTLVILEGRLRTSNGFGTLVVSTCDVRIVLRQEAA